VISFIYLTPRRVFDLNPPLLQRRGGEKEKRGFAPLGRPYFGIFGKGIKRGDAPLRNSSLSPYKGERDKG